MPAFDRPGTQQFVSWQDMARTPDESLYPEMWDTVDGYWLTELGQTGSKLINLGHTRARNDGAFLGDSLPAWLPMDEDGRHSLDFQNQSTQARVDCGSLNPDTPTGGTAPRRNEITIGAYVFKESDGSGDPRFLSKAFNQSGGNHDYMIGHSSPGSNLRTRFRIGTTTFTDSTTSQTTAGETHFYCGTFDGADVKHWRDGVLVGTFSHAGTLGLRGSTFRTVLGNSHRSTPNAATDGRICMWIVAGRVLQPWEMYELSRDPAILVRPRPRGRVGFVAAAPPITDGEIAAATGPKRHDVDLPPAEVVAY